MKEYIKHLEFYAEDPYEGNLRQKVSDGEWGNRKVAERYLERYWLPAGEYERNWKNIQDSIFNNQSNGLVSLGFQEGFKILPLRGGIMFDEQLFAKLTASLQRTGDEFFVVIQSFHDRTTWGNLTPFRLKYPVGMTWEEVRSGNYISAVLLDWPANEYFIFGNSGKWGMYVANDYIHPLNVVAFQEDCAQVFRDNFNVAPDEWAEIKKWIPQSLKKYL